jgi:hypothetical protein
VIRQPRALPVQSGTLWIEPQTFLLHPTAIGLQNLDPLTQPVKPRTLLFEPMSRAGLQDINSLVERPKPLRIMEHRHGQ